jgi:hypothetical protein
METTIATSQTNAVALSAPKQQPSIPKQRDTKDT